MIGGRPRTNGRWNREEKKAEKGAKWGKNWH